MRLNDIGRVPATTLKKINQHLESNYGFKITEDIPSCDLDTIMETVRDEIVELKITGNTAKESSEISKRMLVLEGLETLREFAVMQMPTPKHDMLIDALTAHVIKEFHNNATPHNHQEAFDDAISDAMKAYRGCECTMPDDYIEQTIRQHAMAKINPVKSIEFDDTSDVNEVSNDLLSRYMQGAMRDTMSNKKDRNPGMLKAMSRLSGTNKPLIQTDEETDEWSSLGRESSRVRHGLDRNMPSISADRPTPSPSADTGEKVPMIRDKHGRMVPDPFAAQAAARRKGISMNEHKNLVKHLRTLLETEVSHAEVMMAAKGFAQELQEMVEKIGRLQNEDLPPVTDQMRETFGTDSASAFQTQIYSAFQSVMDSLYTAKGQVDDAVSSMASTGQVTASNDMEMDVTDDAPEGDAPPELDLDNIDDELADETDDEFGGAETEEPLGRAMKTESAILRKKIAEMRNIVEKARKLKESKK